MEGLRTFLLSDLLSYPSWRFVFFAPCVFLQVSHFEENFPCYSLLRIFLARGLFFPRRGFRAVASSWTCYPFPSVEVTDCPPLVNSKLLDAISLPFFFRSYLLPSLPPLPDFQIISLRAFLGSSNLKVFRKFPSRRRLLRPSL